MAIAGPFRYRDWPAIYRSWFHFLGLWSLLGAAPAGYVVGLCGGRYRHLGCRVVLWRSRKPHRLACYSLPRKWNPAAVNAVGIFFSPLLSIMESERIAITESMESWILEMVVEDGR